jgi:hypothetical protein
MKPQGPLVLALGVAQVVSWGSLFYSIGVLGPAMSRDVGGCRDAPPHGRHTKSL